MTPERLTAALPMFNAVLLREVLLHRFDSMLIDMPSSIRKLTGSTETRVTMHQAMIVLGSARMFMQFEFNDAVGEDFMTQTPDELLGNYVARARMDDSVLRTRAEYIALFEAADAATVIVPAPDGRADYALRRRFHYDVHLARHVFLIDLNLALAEPDAELRATRCIRCGEFFVKKCDAIYEWVATGAAVDPALRYRIMSTSVANAPPGGGLTERVQSVSDPSYEERMMVAHWATVQAKFDANFERIEAKGDEEDTEMKDVSVRLPPRNRPIDCDENEKKSVVVDDVVELLEKLTT